ncbi:MAG: DUF3703 domain-containing protein [Phycicoccus sp.]
MSRYGTAIDPAVTRELDRATALDGTDPAAAFGHLERAHVLGQASTRHHVRTHVAMLRWSVRHRMPREVRGQVVRIVGAATKTALRLVPHGNTGGSDVSAFRRMPVAPDLALEIAAARATD